ncbi:hypothetical protein [Staphylococcus delphini]|uniref:hypothetical protein n=1 Tax=Staphylococcus delphini TaxID=53344 RepID=UPI000BBC029D|nr:hypothetical protein [Staphylococcus delphini]PCF48458.1 hypothetical protein B5C09_05460 [Staphylococcus delphini]PCF73149.1 hypothetical protein B4W71_07135 [Staphylococcus delphini]
MLDLILVSKDEKSVTYNYYPNGSEKSGRVTIGINDLEIINHELSEYEKFYETRKYLGHAIHRIKENIKINEFPETELVAWG